MKTLQNKVAALRNTVAMFLRRNLPYNMQIKIIQIIILRKNFLHSKLEKSTRATNSINTREKRIYSQNGEDGIIEYLIDHLKIKKGICIEIGMGDGIENNTANLILNHQWNALLIDRAPEYLALANYYYKKKLKSDFSRIKIINAEINRENCNTIIAKNTHSPIVDILSIDIDGNDYWIWESIDKIDPKIIVIEYNAHLTNHRSITTQYDPSFYVYAKHPSGLYYGASLMALQKLAERKGYALVGCDKSGTNAFFIKKRYLDNKLQALTPQQAFYPNRFYSSTQSMDEQFKIISQLPYIEI